jgi:hypothetical protein
LAVCNGSLGNPGGAQLAAFCHVWLPVFVVSHTNSVSGVWAQAFPAAKVAAAIISALALFIIVASFK